MSYCRWGCLNEFEEPSYWYVYHGDEDRLIIDGIASFSQDQLIFDLESCLDYVKLHMSNKKGLSRDPSENDYKALRGYMEDFRDRELE